jgi:hypothetical protein
MTPTLEGDGHDACDGTAPLGGRARRRPPAAYRVSVQKGAFFTWRPHCHAPAWARLAAASGAAPGPLMLRVQRAVPI